MVTVSIIGQGYVGLPLSHAAASSGVRVFGVDANQNLVSSLNSGKSHIDDLSDQEVREMLAGGYRATTDYSVIAESDYVVICVPTPLGEDGGPDLSILQAAANSIAENLVRGTTVILESTTYPGTTEEVVLPILESSGLEHGRDYHLAFSPERVDPGRQDYGIKNTPKLVGGVNATATSLATSFYSAFVESVVPLAGTREAETAKLLENTYRHVNIALVNEMARFCHDMGIDIWEVIRGASTKPFGFQRFTPGPGVGGHCIPIDPNYLSHHVKKTLGYPFRFVELAQEINSMMPQYIVQRASDVLNANKKALNGSTVLLVGVTYKPNIADQRESPAVPIAQSLSSKGADVRYFDPYVPEWTSSKLGISSVEDPYVAAMGADIVILLQNHRDIDLARLAKASQTLLDTRGQVQAEDVNVSRL